MKFSKQARRAHDHPLRLRRGRIVAALAALALLAAGCGETVIDSAKVEDQAHSDLERNLPEALAQGTPGEQLQERLGISSSEGIESVDCPSGVGVEAGVTFDCTVTFANGRQATETFKVLNDEAKVEAISFKPRR